VWFIFLATFADKSADFFSAKISLAVTFQKQWPESANKLQECPLCKHRDCVVS
jgi:hypothetical protein